MRKFTLFISMLLTLSVSAANGWFNDFLTIKVDGVQTTNNYFIGDNPSTGAMALEGANFGVVSNLSITSCDMKYWSDTQDRLGGAFYYKVMSADG